MNSHQVRQSFFDFFASKGHQIIPSAPVIPHGDPTLLFTNAGMNQFKEVFLGTGKRDYTRVADTQKCIRVSGKHNDLEEVGRDTYHHTFFEMLGNWSFGDYYKKEAIAWAWELLTGVWKLPKERLWATVYETDAESLRIWHDVTDIDESHILRFGEKENFWEMGDAGPCGPCSEIHIDLTPRGDAPAALVNAGTPDLIEIWNLVFIQNNRLEDGHLEDLPSRHVDTGMGFERACAVMKSMETGFKRSPSNYDTDLFTPLIARISALSGKEYRGGHSDSDVAIRVIADHIRALSFAIADGALPSNEGRGYVLRRILRRAARFGRTLGLHEPFLHTIVGVLVDSMGDVFGEIRDQRRQIEQVIKGEEEAFNQALDRGLEIFEQAVAGLKQSKAFPGEIAFKLYDTFGFPLDLTELLSKERGLSVDIATFTDLMEQQRDRARAARSEKLPTSEISVMLTEGEMPELATEFTGYGEELETDAVLVHARQQGNLVIVGLSKTPLYAESGGQVSDTGTLRAHASSLRVIDSKRHQSGIYHIAEFNPEFPLRPGEAVRASVDLPRRLSIMRNHTATHLVHAALRKVLGTHVHQAGSLVAPDHLRFDFAHFNKVTPEEIAAIESLVNEKIAERMPLEHHRNIPFEEAKKMGALMFFGDKYGDRVNVVQFGDFSMEFCGGTHVRNSGDIGFFKIQSEGSSASGVRRIEAVTGEYGVELLALQRQSARERIEYAQGILEEIRGLEQEIGIPSGLGKESAELEALGSSVGHRADGEERGLSEAFTRQQEEALALENLVLALADRKKSLDRQAGAKRIKNATADLDPLISRGTTIGGATVVTGRMNAADMEALKSLGDALRQKLKSGVGILAAIIDGKVALVCVVTDDLIASKGLAAGKIVGALAKVVGGGGGGKPHLATAGGKDVGKIDEALRSAGELVRSMITS